MNKLIFYMLSLCKLADFRQFLQFTCAAMCVTMSLLFRPKNTLNAKQLCPKAQVLTSVQNRDPVKQQSSE